MELELGLGLPNNKRMPRELDLNLDRGFEEDPTQNPDSFNNSSSSSSGEGRRGKSVKVTMEGVPIGRKVNLSIHHSYRDLLQTLHEMFPCHHHDENAPKIRQPRHHQHHCTITYEDADGDWMMLGDVPWEVFIQSVKRLKIFC